MPSPDLPGDANFLHGVDATSPTDATSGSNAWAVSMTLPSTCGPKCETLILHWNGKTWS
jgi:hypothetical protein